MNTTFDKALLKVIGRRAPDRVRIYRRYLREGMRFDAFMQRRKEGVEWSEFPFPDDTEVAAVIAQHRAEGFDPGQLRDFVRDFKRWEPSLRRERARAAAKARWKKRRLAPEKTLATHFPKGSKSQKSIKHRRKVH